MASEFAMLSNGNLNPPELMEAATADLISAEAMQFFRDGVALLDAAEPQRAVAAFSRSVECAPYFANAHVCLGVAHAMTSTIYPAFDHLERATGLDPGSFVAHFILAQLAFKLRIPEKGYQEAERALSCAETSHERRMVAQLLRQERERERHGIKRPWFNKPFNIVAVFMSGSGFAALLAVLFTHLR